MAEPSFLDPSPFENFPQFDASDLSFDDPDLFPDGGFSISTTSISTSPSTISFFPRPMTAITDPAPIPIQTSPLPTPIPTPVQIPDRLNPETPRELREPPPLVRMLSRRRTILGSRGKLMITVWLKTLALALILTLAVGILRYSDLTRATRHGVLRAGTEEDEKRRARMMRNRESAQLSRQRKKQYVEELEEKVKLMNSTIADLNGKISFYMTENARLHQQLSENGANGSDGKGNPPPPPQYYFPWIPYGGYPMRHNGPPVPYVPIPRLKPQQPVSAPKVKKTERKKSESKMKKVASVSLLGLFFVMMVFGGVRDFGLGGNKNKVYDGFGGSHGRVLTVEDRGNSLNNTQEYGQFSGKMDCGGRGRQNSSESLPALLYVPRNGKHVEINGNLIIHSVLASERAMAQTKSRGQEKQLSVKEGTGLMIPVHVASALAIREGAMGVGTHSRAYRNSAEYPRALGSGSHDAYRDNIKSTLADGPLQQWFREGLAGNDDIYCSSYLL
ncbi:uncharacterized protein A4U43_UnF4170 [Asparagus officinalis]|uniref:BZIP domain-containing protein n=1 Tax=Asparagus officinalis TaxID=4686 RepID=A0A1R3L6X4_ASPOF|nr:bZIP transcription factor 39-like [Asparagus officinalis]ONK55381.1 uncharacterized protein A4U43_UnF4170 [Asparagus officinalis]